jgi:hypothetical protein
MSRVPRLLRVCLLLLVAFGWQAVPAGAQQQVRVLADQTMVWNPGFRSVATVVRAGTVFEVVSRQGDWFEVELPGAPDAPPTGMIAVSRVEVIGSGTVPTRPSVRRAPQRRPSMPATRRGPPRPSPWYGFGTLGYGRFTASKSVDAVTGSANGLWYGGGVRYQHRSGFFVEGAVERYQKTGERVFVFEDTVFPLGIENRVEITPLVGTAGYAFRIGRLRPYVGAGGGAYLYRETSDFADDADNVRETHPAYRGVAGVQWPVGTGIAAAVEVVYTTVPDALTGGAAAAFNETDLGGVQVRGRLVFGR